MDFIQGIIIVCFLIYLWHKYWANDSEKNVRSIGDYYEEKIDRLKNSTDTSLEDYRKEYEELLKRLKKSYFEYLRLLEKYRHNIIQQWNLRQDWRLYLQAHKDIRKSDMDFGILNDEKLLQKAGERQYRAEIRLDEIEKRFKKLI